MSRRYVHFFARDLKDAALELHGFKEHFAFRAVLLICSSRNYIDFPVFFSSGVEDSGFGYFLSPVFALECRSILSETSW